MHITQQNTVHCDAEGYQASINPLLASVMVLSTLSSEADEVVRLMCRRTLQ